MNLPNKLTLLRVFMVPIFVAFALITNIPNNYFWALIIFVIASLTDALDGHIARKYKLITNFGKFLDPLADKVLVMSALLCFVELELISSVPVIIILAREFMVTGLRLVARSEVTIAAGIWGKLKTAFTMATIAIILAFQSVPELINSFSGHSAELSFNYHLIGNILIWISTALTIISGLQYLFAYKSHINTNN